MAKIDEIKMLRLGQRDENLSRSLTFDCSDWLEQYPEASIHVLFRRPGESAIVPMSTTLEGTTLTWLIHDFEVGKTGIGNAEFRAVDTAGLRRKSRIIPCSIEETLLGDDETVLYTQDQVDETLAHIGEAAQSALAAKASEEAAALSASEAGESAVSAGTAADVAVSARDAAQAAQTAAETAQHQAEAAQSGVHADAEAAEQAKVAAQAAQASAQGAASQASADRTAAESARADAEAAATHAEAVVEGIDQAGADQVAAVNAAGQAQVTAVNQAGATQVGNVNTAGTTQVNAVQAKGTQVINSIPADYSALTDDVTELKSAIDHSDACVGMITGGTPIQFSNREKKQYIVTNGTTVQWDTPAVSSGTKIKWAVVPCQPGDKFTINGRGGGSDRLWAFADSAKNILDPRAGSGAVATNLVITAPENAAWLILNTETDKESCVGIPFLTQYVDSIEKTYFVSGFSCSASTSSTIVTWSRLYIKFNGTEYDVTAEKSFTLSDSKPVLVLRGNDVVQLNGYSNTQSTDVVLFIYRGRISGGLLYPYYANKGLTIYNPLSWFTNGFKSEKTYDGVKLSWTRLYVQFKNSTFDTTTAASYTLSNNNPILAIRNGSSVVTTTFGNLRSEDIVLFCYYYGVNGGLLYPLYVRTLNNYEYDDDAHLNVYKQVQRLANLKWTPLSAITDGEGDHPAGVEITGVPYSSVKEYLKYVGIDVSIHTFMTSIHDPHSLMYTENPDYYQSESAYGRTYHGVNCHCYFGSVCSGLVTTAIGSTIQYNSWEYQVFPGVFKVLENQDIRNLRVGDIMSYDGHCGVITNVKRDNDGTMLTLQFDEHSAPIHIGAGHTPATLQARTNTSKGVWCRYDDIDCNTKYIPSPFVLSDGEYLYAVDDFVYVDGVNSRTFYRCKTANRDSTFSASKWTAINPYTPGTAYTGTPPTYASVGDKLYQCVKAHTAGETFSPANWKEIKGINEWASYPYTYNDDIVTFAGDRAAFHSNDLIYINYAKGSYTKMQLYKDGTLIQTISLPSTGYQIDVSSYCSGAGMYKARLTDETNYSRYTYFEVIDSTASATFADGEATISFSSSNGTPVEWQIVEHTGATVCHNAFTDEEIANGVVVVNPKAKMFAEKYIYPNRYQSFADNVYARVMFKGEYGNVVNDMILLGEINNVGGVLVLPNEPKELGTISTATNINLESRLSGNVYTFSFIAASGASVAILPSIGTIKWANELPGSLVDGTTYLVTINNGIGTVLSVT